MAERTRVDLVALFPPTPPGRLREKLPALAERLDALIATGDGAGDPDWESKETYRTVFATRDLAREVAQLLPAGPVVLDCSRVEVLSVPFVHELLRLRRDIDPDGLNEDAAEAWAIAHPGAQDGPRPNTGDER